MSLLSAALDDANLFEAWQKVRGNGGAAGVDGQSLDFFAKNVFGRLQTLREHVLTGEYRPQPLLQCVIPKDNGKLRYLAVPTVRDRVLQTAVARVLTPELEREFEHASYAYRAGRSVQMAVARVAHYRDQGFQWVVDADIQSYFDEVAHPLLIAKLKRTLSDHSLLPLVELWLASTIQPPDSQPYLLDKGIPQGSPLSPVLANLYLDDFDEALLGENMRLVRFADDFLILCRSEAEAEAAMELTESVIERLQLKLNTEKTRIVHFDAGFRFLGVDFLRNLMEPAAPTAGRWLIPSPEQRAEAARQDASAHVPEEAPTGHDSDDEAAPSSPACSSPLLDAHRESRPEAGRKLPRAMREVQVAESPACGAGLHDWSPEADGDSSWELTDHEELSPAVRSLYVCQQGVQLLKEQERVLIAKKKEVLLSWPLGKLDEIVIHGNALMSTALIRHCAREGIAVTFAEAGGTVRCALDSSITQEAVDRLAAQLAVRDTPDLVLMLARAMIDGKIHNQRTLLKRYNRRRKIEEIEFAQLFMAEMQKKLSVTATLDEVRGCEGQAARLYFGALARLLPPEWQFTGRTRRPPADPVNALLSMGYGVLYKTVLGFLQRQRLNPYIGSLHAVKPGHAALASDLVEEFRAPVVDTCVLQLLLENKLSPEDFAWEGEEGNPERRTCTLRSEARKRATEFFATKYRTQLIHPNAGMRLDLHRAILYQVDHYRRVVERAERVYNPFKLR